MLALTRKAGQSIIIDGKIEIVIVDVKGDQVRVGINAPKDVSILRKELHEEVEQENKKAAYTSNVSLEGLDEILSEAVKQGHEKKKD